MKPALLLTLEYPPQVGGIANYLERLVECFDMPDIQVLASPHEAAHEYDMRSPVPIFRHALTWRFPKPSWLPAWYWTHWLEKRERGYGCIIVSHVLPLGTVANTMLVRHKTPYIVILHGMDAALALDARGRKRREAVRVLRDAAIVAVNSEFTAGLARALGVAPTKIILARPSPGPVAAIGVSDEQRAAVRQKYAPHGETLLLSAGRLVSRKGFDTAIQAVVQLKSRGRQARLVIVGDGPDAPRLKKLIEEAGVGDDVIFAGLLTDKEMAATQAAADVFVMVPRGQGADIEGFGIVYLEAGAFGKPVIGSRSGGVPEAVIDGETGLLVPPNDSAALADAIDRLISDPELGLKMGMNGHRRVNREFGGCHQPAMLVAAIKRLCQSK